MTSGAPTSRGRRGAVKPTPLAFMVLALLYERPMHPYEMQRVMSYRGKDEIVNVQRGSLYPAVERLVKAGLVEPAETVREGRRPERTTYRLTEDGQETCTNWLTAMLQTPHQDFPEFPVALAFLPVLDPQQVRSHLMGRMLMLSREVAAMETTGRMFTENFNMPRLFGIEDEFRLHMVRAELAWVTALVDDLKSGDLDWSSEKIAQWAAEIEAKVGMMPGVGPGGLKGIAAE